MEWAATTSTIISILQYLSAPADSRTIVKFSRRVVKTLSLLIDYNTGLIEKKQIPASRQSVGLTLPTAADDDVGKAVMENETLKKCQMFSLNWIQNALCYVVWMIHHQFGPSGDITDTQQCGLVWNGKNKAARKRLVVQSIYLSLAFLVPVVTLSWQYSDNKKVDRKWLLKKVILILNKFSQVML